MKLTPFLLFDGTCAEAMAFYRSCFDGDLAVTRLGDTPMKDQMPLEQHNKVVHAHLKSGAIEFSATDWLHPSRKPVHGNTAALYLTGESLDEMKVVFEKLAVGAPEELIDELKAMPFGVYGHLADRYGVHWFFQVRS